MARKLDYVANQHTAEGLDEIQRVILAYHLQQHVAMAGPPGVGKTVASEVVPVITGRPLYDTTLDELTQESELVGFPLLVKNNGSAVTKWQNGLASNALQLKGIFYGDEFDQLPGTLQKRLNSAFDHRRRLRRRDGVDIAEPQEGEGHFMAIISYNPSDRLSRKELEDSVADRFVHVPFTYLTHSLEAAIAAGDRSHLTIEERGILLTNDGPQFLRKDRDHWKDYFTGKSVNPKGEVISYDSMIQSIAPGTLPDVVDGKLALAQRITGFFDTVRTFAESGTNKLPDPIKTYLTDIGEITQVRLHKPSARIIKSAIDQYGALVSMGMDPQKAQVYAARVCVDQICYGKFALQPLGSVTVRDAVESLAQYHQLLAAREHRTDL